MGYRVISRGHPVTRRLAAAAALTASAAMDDEQRAMFLRAIGRDQAEQVQP